MESWRNWAWAGIAAAAVSFSCARVGAQTLRILPEAELTGAEVEIEAVEIPAEDGVTPEPFVEEPQDWVESAIGPAEGEVYYEGDAGPPVMHGRHGRLRSHLARSQQHAEDLYSSLRAPERTRSWTNRPLSIGFFAGGIFGSELVSDRIDQESGFFTGGRMGWDFAERWGLETRIGFSDMNLRAEDPDVFLDKNDIFYWDADLMYYPWGESRLRPFLTVGLGMHQPDFVDDTGYRVKDTVFAAPFGFGFKYRIDQRIVLRFELQDNYAFAGGHDVEATNNISVTGGLEFRFGGRKKSYWPWDPGRTWW